MKKWIAIACVPIFVAWTAVLQSSPDQACQGFSKPIHAVDLTPQRGGQVSEIPVKEGHSVDQNTVLLKLASGPEEAALKAMEAKLSDRSAERQAEARVAFAEARAAASKEHLAAARDELIALEELFGENSTSERELAQARHACEEAKANYEASKADIRISKAELDAAVATHKQLALEVEARRLEVAQFILRAPFSGVVTRVTAELGQITSPNEPVLRLVQLDTLVLEFYVPRIHASSLQAGQKVSVFATHADGSHAEVHAEVVFVSPELDSATNTQRVVLHLENTDQQWPAGMTVTWKF